MSPNARVSASAPLDGPTTEEAQALMPRLYEIRESLENTDRDWHGRPIGNRDEAALGQLWEEWRDSKLGVLNGYREVWNQVPPAAVPPA